MNYLDFSQCLSNTMCRSHSFIFFDPQSVTTRGDTRTGRITDAAPKISCTDWERNMPVNHIATATATWVSTKLQYSEEDLEWIRSWPAWIPIEYIKKTLENTTQIEKAVSNYLMVRSRNDRHGVHKRVSFDPNLDPNVTPDEENQNVESQLPPVFRSEEIPMDDSERCGSIGEHRMVDQLARLKITLYPTQSQRGMTLHWLTRSMKTIYIRG
jgi:hypothetical protein